MRPLFVTHNNATGNACTILQQAIASWENDRRMACKLPPLPLFFFTSTQWGSKQHNREGWWHIFCTVCIFELLRKNIIDLDHTPSELKFICECQHLIQAFLRNFSKLRFQFCRNLEFLSWVFRFFIELSFFLDIFKNQPIFPAPKGPQNGSFLYCI